LIFPAVAPLGIFTSIVVSVSLVMVASTPLNVTFVAAARLVPLM
jgi:hypothetical protein